MKGLWVGLLAVIVAGCTIDKCVYIKLYDETSEVELQLPEVGYAPFSADGGSIKTKGRVGYFSMPVGETWAETVQNQESCLDRVPAVLATGP